MSSWKHLVLALALVLGAAAPAVFAQPLGRGGAGLGHLDGGRMMELLEDVGATEAQRRQIRDIYTAARADLSTLRSQVLSLRQRQLALWSAATIDAVSMEAVRKQLQDVRGQVEARLQRALVDAGRVLSPDQRQKMSQRLAGRMQHMKEQRDAT